ncbi:hypothetical protein [Ensifer canadensis]|uniref:hypothetical protein n=1 Tax=Ensifer canadensis TaxID=555315 RepID=UPI0035E3C50F
MTISEAIDKIHTMRLENSGLRDALSIARERVRNLDRDMACNLPVNRDKFWDVIEEIDNALNQRETANAQ